MNDIRLEHPGSDEKLVMGGVGNVFVNGHQIEGVLEFTPHLSERNDVAHVTIKLAVSSFTYGPQKSVEYQFLDSDRAVRIPTA